MKFFPIKRLNAGIEISSDKIRTALIFQKGDIVSIKDLYAIDLMPETIIPSFRKENIVNIELFQDSLKKIRKKINLKKINVSLPDASVKVFIRKFSELPKGIDQINEMILWDISSSLNIAAEQLRVSWKHMGKNSDYNHVFLVVLSLEKILNQYETAFKKVDFSPVMLTPSRLNQFNFYSKIIPEMGCIAYLCLFDDFLNIFVFSDNIPIFYKMIKKGLLSDNGSSAINDVDLLIQYYNSENPDLEIENFFIASHIKSDLQMEQVLQDINPIDFTIIDERKLIKFDDNFKDDNEDQPLHFYTAALGVAQGLQEKFI